MIAVWRNRAGRRPRKSALERENPQDLPDAELREWAQRFGISVEELRHAIVKVGPSPTLLARHLRRSA
jgi:hypothetical protein